MTAKATIVETRTFSADAAGMPAARELALSKTTFEQRQPLSEEQQRAYLRATGVEPIDYGVPATVGNTWGAATVAIGHGRPMTLADAYLIANEVPFGELTPDAQEQAEANQLGADWVALTVKECWC